MGIPNRGITTIEVGGTMIDVHGKSDDRKDVAKILSLKLFCNPLKVGSI